MKGILSSRLSRALALVALALAIPTAALADELIVDNDIVSPGLQNQVELTVAAGTLVHTSTNVGLEYKGPRHLAAGDKLDVLVDDQKTDLPSGYDVTDLSLTVPSGWGDGKTVFGTSNISFKAPSTPGTYTYTVKWMPTEDPDKAISGGPAFTIKLTVTEQCTYSVHLLYDSEKAKNGGDFPIKLQMMCGETNVSSEDLVLTALKVIDSNDKESDVADSGKANPENLFRYDGDLQGYIFNLDIKDLAAGSYTLTFKVAGDDTVFEAPFAVDENDNQGGQGGQINNPGGPSDNNGGKKK